MMDPDIQRRIDKLYAEMKPLQEHYGIQSKTIEERYREHLQKKAVIEQMQISRPKPRFKLPKL
jgi:hypothetical protein